MSRLHREGRRSDSYTAQMGYEDPERKKEDEIDAMEVAEDWPFSQREWICKETGEHARVNPLDPSIVGCLKCQFRTRNPAKTGHFRISTISPEQ